MAIFSKIAFWIQNVLNSSYPNTPISILEWSHLIRVKNTYMFDKMLKRVYERYQIMQLWGNFSWNCSCIEYRSRNLDTWGWWVMKVCVYRVRFEQRYLMTTRKHIHEADWGVLGQSVASTICSIQESGRISVIRISLIQIYESDTNHCLFSLLTSVNTLFLLPCPIKIVRWQELVKVSMII